MYSENEIGGISLQEMFDYLRDNLRFDTNKGSDSYFTFTEVSLYLRNPETNKEELISDVKIYD